MHSNDSVTLARDVEASVVPVGTKVTWINHDDVPHTVVSTDKKTFVSPALDTDEKFSHTFHSGHK